RLPATQFCNRSRPSASLSRAPGGSAKRRRFLHANAVSFLIRLSGGGRSSAEFRCPSKRHRAPDSQFRMPPVWRLDDGEKNISAVPICATNRQRHRDCLQITKQTSTMSSFLQRNMTGSISSGGLRQDFIECLVSVLSHTLRTGWRIRAFPSFPRQNCPNYKRC